MSPGDVLRCLRDDRMPFALVGRWASGVLVGSEPVRVVDGVPPAAEGWWVGFLGFGTRYEALPPSPPRPVPMPDARFALYDHVLQFDGDRWWLLGSDHRLAELEERLRAPSRRPYKLGPLRPHGAGATGHVAAVADCVERIAAGELFQANLCLRLEASFEGSAVDAFASAAEVLQPAHGAYVDGVLSFSPELFLRREGREVVTGPIKGTSTDRDALVASEKDAAEHVMIVDLMRNDLGRVAEYGSVHAPSTPTVEAHPGLFHLVSYVRGTLREEVSDADLLRATFPPGSVTGAPKIQALKVISASEGTAREVYTGAIGVIGPEGLELNVAIRTLEVSGNAAWLGVGGGIVADSRPEDELREAFVKARPIAAALGSAVVSMAPTVPPRLPGLSRRPDPRLGVYETLLVRDGVVVAADRHLARLRASLRALYGISPEIELPGIAGDARLRVTVRPSGAVEVFVGEVGEPRPLRLDPVVVPGGLGAHKWADRAPLTAFEAPGVAALICDADGTVLEASSANVWALIDGELVTPPADGRILPGITRAWLLEAGVGREAAFTLEQAQTLVVTSSIRGAAAASPDALDLAADLRARLAERR